jgi:hypothetical protein
MRYDRGMEQWPSGSSGGRFGGWYDDVYRRADPGRFARRGAYDRPMSRRGGYGGDYWWLGEREMERQGNRATYDEAYRRFSERYRPRFSPVGGMHPATSGRYASRPPRALREPTWFSDWTRWF